jgi:uncharacterized phiE125 gp8 family phage protein
MYIKYDNHVAWPYIVTVAPTTLPLTINEVKEHLRLDLTDKTQDALLKVLIRAATDYAEKYTKKDLITRTYETFRDSFDDSLEIRRSPLQSVTTVEYLKNGVFVTVSTDIYFATNSNTFAHLALKVNQVWPSDVDLQEQSVKITFKSGYGNNLSSAPDALREGILQHIAAMYENRGDCNEGRVSGGSIGNAQKFLPIDAQLIYDQFRIRSL